MGILTLTYTNLMPNRHIARVVMPFMKSVELRSLALNTSLLEAHTVSATRIDTISEPDRANKPCCKTHENMIDYNIYLNN